MNNTYFVFNYYHNKEHSAWVPLKVINSKMGPVKGYGLVNPEEHPAKFWQERCLKFLQEQKVKVVFSCQKKNSMEERLFGFPIHYSGGEGGDFFHYDFINPQFQGYKFEDCGIELKIFDRR